MDNSVSDSQQILLVSGDSFVEGLIRGYCLAHCLDLVVRRFANGLVSETTVNTPRLLILDRRNVGKVAEMETAAWLEMVHALTTHAYTPLCIISDSAETLPGQYLYEHDYVIGEPLAEQLNQCLRKYTGQNRKAYAERRRQDRREWQDRRERQDRRHDIREELSRPVIASYLPKPVLQEDPNYYAVGPFTVDPDSRQVAMNNRGLCLSTKEFQLFHLLASNVGKVLTADAIIVELWPENSRANKSDLYQYIHLLRRKIEPDSQCPRWLVTVKGVGYRLCPRPAESGLLRYASR